MAKRKAKKATDTAAKPKDPKDAVIEVWDAATAAAETKKDEPEMLRYEDYRGKVKRFPKPPTPNMIDLIDQETWGSEDEEILPEDEEESEEEVEYRFVPPEERRKMEERRRKKVEELDPDEKDFLEKAREQDRRVAEERQRKKLERVKKKEAIIRERFKNEMEATWNFPIDPEGWTEEDLGEEWMDPPAEGTGTGHDPRFPELPPEEEYDQVLAEHKKKMRKQAKKHKKFMADLKKKRMEMLKNPPDRYDPKLFARRKKRKIPTTKDGLPARPYYVPYRESYPLIPKIHPEIENALDVVEELEKLEEFLQWGSFIFEDGSSYEGTVWDDLAHGKGVYTSIFEEVQYEGMWRRNMMEGHGVMQVNIPVYQPPPDSKLEKKMRKQGWIIKADYMPREERAWIKKDIQDTLEKPDILGKMSDLFENDQYWIDTYGYVPEKGRYMYSGQWKHNRMHGCGVLDVNMRLIYGKFYFGDLLGEPGECTVENCAIHSGLAQVAAAKARMFTKKPDGMVREMDGPFNDPQHPYFYEEDEVWMAPGWVNAYHEVPDRWKLYVEEVDKEQQMWLNSFIKSPLRIPMPAELEYMWENGDEFVLLSNQPSSLGWLDEENILKSHPNFKGDILYHVPTGQLINWIEDENGFPQFFLQPYKEDGSINPEEAVFLPEGWDEFFSDEPLVFSDEERDPEDLSREERLKQYKEEDEKREREWQQEDEEIKQKLIEEEEERKEEQRLKAEIDNEVIEEELRRLDDIEKASDEAAKARKEGKKESPEKPEKIEEMPDAIEDEEAEAEAEIEAPMKEAEQDQDQEQDQEEEQEPEAKSFGKTADEDEPQPRSFGRVDQDGGNDGDDEEDDDDDQDRGGESKPRGFGKVASTTMLDKKIPGNSPKSSFPTAFAAITLSPWLRSFSFPALKRRQRQSRAAAPGSGHGDDDDDDDDDRASSSSQLGMEPVTVSCATKRSFVRLKAARSRCSSSAVLLGNKNRRVLPRQSGRRSIQFAEGDEDDVFSIAIPV